MKSKILRCETCKIYAISNEIYEKEDLELFRNRPAKPHEVECDCEDCQLIDLEYGVSFTEDDVKALEALDEKQSCPQCNQPMRVSFPPRFSIQDKYQKYRMEHFKEKMHEQFDYIFQKDSKEKNQP